MGKATKDKDNNTKAKKTNREQLGARDNTTKAKNTTKQQRGARDNTTKAQNTTKAKNTNKQQRRARDNISTMPMMKERRRKEWKLCNQHALMGCLAP